MTDRTLRLPRRSFALPAWICCAAALTLAAAFPAVAQRPAIFQAPGLSPSQQTVWVAADFDGDQKSDFVSLSAQTWGGLPGGGQTLRSGPADPRIFASPSGFPANQRLRARDLDGDADRDVVLESSSSVAIAVWLNDGHGNFQRGNLDDFQFELSHGNSQSLTATIRLVPTELTDECPGSGALRRPSDFGPPPADTSLVTVSETAARGSVRFGIRTRGPPFQS